MDNWQGGFASAMQAGFTWRRKRKERRRGEAAKGKKRERERERDRQGSSDPGRRFEGLPLGQA